MDKATKEAIIKEYARHEGDTGSPEVQVALLTARINHLNDHLKTTSSAIVRWLRSWVCASNSSASFTKRALSQMTVVWETVFVAPSGGLFHSFETKPNAEVGFVYQAARVRV